MNLAQIWEARTLLTDRVSLCQVKKYTRTIRLDYRTIRNLSWLTINPMTTQILDRLNQRTSISLEGSLTPQVCSFRLFHPERMAEKKRRVHICRVVVMIWVFRSSTVTKTNVSQMLMRQFSTRTLSARAHIKPRWTQRAWNLTTTTSTPTRTWVTLPKDQLRKSLTILSPTGHLTCKGNSWLSNCSKSIKA